MTNLVAVTEEYVEDGPAVKLVTVRPMHNGWKWFIIRTDQRRPNGMYINTSTYWGPSEIAMPLGDTASLPDAVHRVVREIKDLPGVVSLYVQLASPFGNRIAVKTEPTDEGYQAVQQIELKLAS